MIDYQVPSPESIAKHATIFAWIRGTAPRKFLAAAVLLFGFLYLFQTSSVSLQGYDITDMQKQVQTLERENQALDLRVAELRSMGSIQERLKNLHLVAATDVQYVNPPGMVVARR